MTTSTSTAAGTYTITVTGAGARRPTPPPSRSPSPGGGGGGLTNGGFETGTLTRLDLAGHRRRSTPAPTRARTRPGSARTTPTNGDSSIAQTFTVPSTATGISFCYNVICPDTVTYDWATATLKDNTAGTTTTPLAKTCVNPSWAGSRSRRP